MILGILAAVLLLGECGFGLWKKAAKGKISQVLLRKLHCAVGGITIVIAGIHFVLSLSLWKQRPLFMYLSGILVLLCIILTGCLGIGRMNKKRLRFHRLFAILAIVCLCVHVYSGISSMLQYKNAVRNIQIADVEVTGISNGIYQGECDVQYVYAHVQVTVEDGQIIAIQLLEHRNERGTAAEGIADTIIEEQSLAVDAVSGATCSSDVIKKAVENALESAGKQ